MKLDKGGLIACGIYTAYFILLTGLQFLAEAKGGAVLAAFSTFPAMILLFALPSYFGLPLFFDVDSLLNSMWFYYSLSLLTMYLFGWAFRAILKRFGLLDD